MQSMLKGAILGAVVAVASASAALAADIVAPVPRAPALVAPKPVVVATWTSCYLGGNIGLGWTHSQVNDEVSGTPIATIDATNIVGGGQIGCDLQVGNHVVVGIQGMLDASALKGSGGGPLLDPASAEGTIPWFATVTGRLGYAVGSDFMLYAKGGGAWDHNDARIVNGGTTVGTASFNLSGWTAGGGVEWRVRPNVSLFGEYDYLGFNARTVSFTSGDIGRVHQNIQVALVGVNLRFGH